MKLLTVISSEFDKLKRLVVKSWNGKSVTVTAEEVSSYGIDSNPIKGMVAVYAKSEVDGAEVIIGYLNKGRVASIGETRLFSTDSNGELKANVWLKNNGDFLIGDSTNPEDYTNNAVKFNELKTEFNKLKADHNELVEKWNAFCASYVPGSPTTVGLPATLATSNVSANTSDIDNAKHSKIKTK